MFCKKCGGKLESYASNCAFCGAPVEKYNTDMVYVKQEKEAERKPMTAIKWFGLDLLVLIPVLGPFIYVILMFKWSFASNKDLTLRGFARYRLFLMLVGIILIALSVTVIMLNPEMLENLKKLLDD